VTTTISRHGINDRGDGQRSWSETYTRNETLRSGIANKETYDEVHPQVRAIVEEHRAIGTPRQLWEPTQNHIRIMTERYVRDARLLLDECLEQQVDPVLDAGQAALDRAGQAVEEASRLPGTVVTPESGSSFSVADAVNLHEAESVKIEIDISDGKAHHRRTGSLLRAAGRAAPWLEASGFIAFVGFYLNVPILQPWVDFFGWSFSFSVVLVIIVGQTRLVDEAARSHNHAREQVAEGNRHEAERGFLRRNRYLYISSFAALAITSGMIMRGLLSIGPAQEFYTVDVLIFLAVLTGLLMPMLSYLAIALDGSKVSRERDSIARQLDADLDAQMALKDAAAKELDSYREGRATVQEKHFLNICNAVQAAVDEAHLPYNFCRIQIGALEAPPPAPSQRFVRLEDGLERGYISSGLSGAEPVDLLPMMDRISRIVALNDRHDQYLGQLYSIPVHPWAMDS
jgi:hypothetical protein